MSCRGSETRITPWRVSGSSASGRKPRNERSARNFGTRSDAWKLLAEARCKLIERIYAEKKKEGSLTPEEEASYQERLKEIAEFAKV